MQFATLHFAYFFTLVLTVSWWLRSVPVARKWFILLVSYYFYAQFDLKLLALLVASSVWNWAIGEFLESSYGKHARRTWLTVGILGNVGFLGFFKYYNFFQENLESVASLLGLSAHLPLLEVMLPLAISFYTFQGLSYIIDLYRGKGPQAKSLLDFLLFIAFFPQLLIGPICRARDLLPQLENMPNQVPDVSRAVSLIMSGLFKKVVLATFLATHLVDNAFIAPENYSSLELLLALYGYSIQLYCDFSGYTDMARGIGLLLGFQLPENFNNPYASTNIGEYWRRWHMSFSYWLRDYLYFSFGGSRVKRFRAYFNIFLTMIIGGLWHGAGWGYVIWGGMHGIGLAIYKMSLDLRRDHNLPTTAQTFIGKLAGWFVTFNLCVFARLVFRAPDLETAGIFWRQLLEFSYIGHGIEPLVIPVLIIGLGLHFVGKYIRDWFIAFHSRTPWAIRPVVWIALILLIFMLKPSDIAPYIYFKF